MIVVTNRKHPGPFGGPRQAARLSAKRLPPSPVEITPMRVRAASTATTFGSTRLPCLKPLAMVAASSGPAALAYVATLSL
jgi:hypothetical protein